MGNTLNSYIQEDLFNELRWLLCAATEWDAYDKLIDQQPQGHKAEEPCFHLKVYAMDSALLHARSLYEFFTSTENSIERNSKRGRERLTWRNYSSASSQKSGKDTMFMRALHGRVFHLDKDRAGYDEVKRQVVGLAKDILELWVQFSKKPGLEPYAALLVRRDAMKEARNVAAQYGELRYESPFS